MAVAERPSAKSLALSVMSVRSTGNVLPVTLGWLELGGDRAAIVSLQP
jgi:hypothetical protein